MTKQPLIALLTDFGTSDAYVGTMKGVMLSICPTAHLVDITHDIQPQNVRQAAYVLATAYRYFPAHTIFLIVVDPGVGTARAPMAVATDHGLYVAPDNGVLDYVLNQVKVRGQVILDNPKYQLRAISTTFHGRDIFSPAAAYLANGTPITNLGPQLITRQPLPTPTLNITTDRIQGEVLHIDHFGNVITNIGSLTWRDHDALELTPRFGPHTTDMFEVSAAAMLTIGEHTLTPLRRTYSEVAPGELIPLVGSSGHLEIGVNQGHAAHRLGVRLGDPVSLTRLSGEEKAN